MRASDLLDHPTCCPADQESLRDIESADPFPPARPRSERHPARMRGNQSGDEHEQFVYQARRYLARQYDASTADNILNVIEK
jgi:hypothetical protein